MSEYDKGEIQKEINLLILLPLVSKKLRIS